MFVIYRIESDKGLQFDLQRRDFDLAGYFVGKTCMLILALFRFVWVGKFFLD